MITIDQLLESVDLDFEPRFVTKDGNGDVYIFEDTPEIYKTSEQWVTTVPASGLAGYEGLKLAEFENKDWQECIYEVPRKVNYGKLVGKLCRFYDKTTDRRTYGLLAYRANGVFAVCGITTTFDYCEPVRPDDDVIYKDAVNELKGAKNDK
jgi:hypothetical protein